MAWSCERAPESARKAGANLKPPDRSCSFVSRANRQHVLNGGVKANRHYVWFFASCKYFTRGFGEPRKPRVSGVGRRRPARIASEIGKFRGTQRARGGQASGGRAGGFVQRAGVDLEGRLALNWEPCQHGTRDRPYVCNKGSKNVKQSVRERKNLEREENCAWVREPLSRSLFPV
jgi:hypothetical protein